MIQHTIGKAHAMNCEDRGVRRLFGGTAVGVGQLNAGADSDGIEGHSQYGYNKLISGSGLITTRWQLSLAFKFPYVPRQA